MLLPGRTGRRADVETHRDVAPEPSLDLGDTGRREAIGDAVVDRAERDAAVVDGEQGVAQREDLKPSRVGQDRPVPARERVQPAELLDQVLAGTEVEVVGVRKDHGRAGLAYLLRVERLHGRLRPDRHEGGGRDVAVGGVDGSDAGRDRPSPRE